MLWRPRASAKFVDEPGLKIARMDIPRVEGRLSVIDFRYLVGTPEGIEEFTERSPSSPMRNIWTHSAMRTWRLNTTMKENDQVHLTSSGMDFECSAVLLDMDGVLVDSNACERRQWSMWARRHGLDPDQTYVHGIRTFDHIRMVAPDLDAEAESRAYEQIEADDTDGIVACPGAMNLVRSIPSGRWAVVTSGIRPVALARLKAAGLPVPQILLTGEEVSRGKPDPEGFLAAAGKLGVEPSRILVIEDAPAGIRAAKAAEMTAVAVGTTHTAEQLPESDAFVATPEDVTVRASSDRSTLKLVITSD